MKQIPGTTERCFSVTCPACRISEIMCFRSPKIGAATKKQTLSCRLPMFSRLVPMESSNSDADAKRFRVDSGLFGDQLPKTCPNCGGELKILPAIMNH